MADSLIENYKAKHRHPLNKLTHSIGIPMIVLSLPLFLFNWRWALALFIVGWILQFVGTRLKAISQRFQEPDVFVGWTAVAGATRRRCCWYS